MITIALAEDVGPGDVTSNTFVPAGFAGAARYVAKAAGVVAGLPLVPLVFAALDPAVACTPSLADGARVEPGAILARLAGPARALLTGERLSLNLLQRLSGIATLTRRFVERVAGTRAAVLDTRKTVPGLRRLEKYAVRAGGGTNHRMGLHDAVLIKDNHLRILTLSGKRPMLAQAIAEARRALPPGGWVEAEAQSLEEAAELAAAGVDVLMLDNLDLPTMRRALERIAAAAAGRPIRIEVSGGVNLDTVRPIAELGVDWISVGALTHSAPALDISLEIDVG
ncbi:MAG: carboxylating nicotinate-nucleotide diphosphorylase [Planctomycetes bacterium]|nr:carboxylating nicotinate-nucleotide diphosphorylase [Planctomycetota bacterium]